MFNFEESYLCSEQTSPPCLKEFLDNPLSCIIIDRNCSPRKKIINQETSCLSVLEDTCEELELTGNPLNLDLEVPVISPTEKPSNSLGTCFKFSSFSLDKARNILNKELEKCDVPIFCFVNKSDKKTVLLGVSKAHDNFTRWSVQQIGLHPLSHLNIDVALDEHTQYTFGQVLDNFPYVIKNIYNIFGDDIKNVDPEEINNCSVGNITLEISSDRPNDASKENISLQMHLQVILGHKNSPIHYLHQDFDHLLKLFNISENGLKCQNLYESTVLNDRSDANNLMEIVINISELFLNSTPNGETRKKSIIDLKNLRNPTIFDKLWFLLSECQNLSILKTAFVKFFIVSKDQEIVFNDSLLGKYLQNVSTGESTPYKHLTIVQLLNLLIDLGIEKLKNDYFTIIVFYASHLFEDLNEHWRKIQNSKSNNLENTKLIEIFEKKLYFLYRCKMLSEILVFLQKTSCKEFCYYITIECFQSICDGVYKKYFTDCTIDNKSKLFATTQDILSFSCFVEETKNSILYEKKTPITKMIKITTETSTSEVTTVVHASQRQLFPYDIENNEDLWYFTKYVQLVNKLNTLM